VNIFNKRLAIFAHFDKQNIIDPYVISYLEELKKYCEIIFVSDGNVIKQEINKIRNLCVDFLAENHGEYDFGSYKRGFHLIKNKYPEKLREIDELLFVNDSCYLVGSLNKVFADMSAYEDCDAWSLGDDYENLRNKNYYIQTYFIALRKSIFQENFFDQFIKNISPLKSKDELVYHYEIGLSKLLKNHNKKLFSYFSSEKAAAYVAKNCQEIAGDISNIISTNSFLSKEKSLKLVRNIFNIRTTNYLHSNKFYLLLKIGFPLLKIRLIKNREFKKEKLLFFWRQILQKNNPNFDIKLIENHHGRVSIKTKTTYYFKTATRYYLWTIIAFVTRMHPFGYKARIDDSGTIINIRILFFRLKISKSTYRIKLDGIRVSKKIRQAILPANLAALPKKFNLTICHSNPAQDIGGTEKYISSKIDHCLTNKIDSVIIYIKKIKRQDRSGIFGDKFKYGININHQSLSNDITSGQMLNFIRHSIKNQLINNISFENFCLWINNKGVLNKIYNLTKNLSVKKIIFLHDTLFRCPATFLYVNGKYCGAADKAFKVSKCYKCENGGLRIFSDKKIFTKFFNLVDEIICPSTFIKDLLCSYYQGHKFLNKAKVIEHLKKQQLKIEANSNKISHGQKIKIAYLGNIGKIKGFDEFIQLATDKELKKHYEFFIIGQKYEGKERDGIKNIEASYGNKDKSSITGSVISDILYKEKINIAFLFSKIPESYSYTMHEADSACVPIITSCDSGNIAHQIIKGNIRGNVFPDISDVTKFFLDKRRVASFIESGDSVFLKKSLMN
jgi:hypothetical protein